MLAYMLYNNTDTWLVVLCVYREPVVGHSDRPAPAALSDRAGARRHHRVWDTDLRNDVGQYSRHPRLSPAVAQPSGDTCVININLFCQHLTDGFSLLGAEMYVVTSGYDDQIKLIMCCNQSLMSITLFCWRKG